MYVRPPLLADMTDKVMDGYIAGFPDTYAEKVGASAALQISLVGAVVCLAFEQKTSDTMHKACCGFLLIPHCF